MPQKISFIYSTAKLPIQTTKQQVNVRSCRVPGVTQLTSINPVTKNKREVYYYTQPYRTFSGSLTRQSLSMKALTIGNKDHKKT